MVTLVYILRMLLTSMCVVMMTPSATGIDDMSGTFAGGDGTVLAYRRIDASRERLRVVVSHGLGEHSGRYANLTGALCPMGASLWIPDHRGHGRSQGRRGHVSDFGEYAADLKRLIDRARSDGIPLLLIGHSMGGLIALSLVRRFPGAVDGLVVSSPLLGLSRPLSPLMNAASRFLAAFFPKLLMPNGLDVGYISHDANTVTAYKTDPLVHDRISARWVASCMDEIAALDAAPDAFDLPLLMQIAGDDHLVSPAASLAFFERLGTRDKTLHHYENLYHEIYNEPTHDRQPVLDDLKTWVARRFLPERDSQPQH
jgi:alpha-beta hydrolase superfamily lysophospholipase